MKKLDSYVPPIPCPGCGEKINRAVREFDENDMTTCSICGHAVQVRGIKNLNNVVSKSIKSLAKGAGRGLRKR